MKCIGKCFKLVRLLFYFAVRGYFAVSEGALQGGPWWDQNVSRAGTLVYGESSTTSAASELLNSIALTVMHLEKKEKVSH